jgi:hypothetical protein
MRKHNLLHLTPIAACVGLVFFAGCSEKTAVVSGKLVLPSNLKLVENDSVTLVFVPDGQGSKSPGAVYSIADNTFKAKDVPPGKYKITISITPYPGKENEKRKAICDQLNSVYDGKATKLSCEITTDANQSLIIDADKGTVTKG